MLVRFAVFLIVLGATPLFAEDLRSPLAQSGPVILHNDFNQTVALDRKTWQPRQHTQWTIQGGVLHGEPSTAEYQQSRQDHRGLEPRLMIRNLPQEYIVDFAFRISAGEYTAIGAFIEFGHHMSRISFKQEGAVLTMGSKETLETIQEAPGFRLEPNRWYKVHAELVSDKLVVEFQNGPTFSTKHPTVAAEKDGLGLCGLRGGMLDIDDVTVRAISTR